jgi:hypothetical protein
LNKFVLKASRFPNKKGTVDVNLVFTATLACTKRAVFITKKGTFGPLKKFAIGNVAIGKIQNSRLRYLAFSSFWELYLAPNDFWLASNSTIRISTHLVLNYTSYSSVYFLRREGNIWFAEFFCFFFKTIRKMATMLSMLACMILTAKNNFLILRKKILILRN